MYKVSAQKMLSINHLHPSYAVSFKDCTVKQARTYFVIFILLGFLGVAGEYLLELTICIKFFCYTIGT